MYYFDNLTSQVKVGHVKLGVIICLTPTQPMHCYKGNSSKLSYICIVSSTPKWVIHRPLQTATELPPRSKLRQLVKHFEQIPSVSVRLGGPKLPTTEDFSSEKVAVEAEGKGGFFIIMAKSRWLRASEFCFLIV